MIEIKIDTIDASVNIGDPISPNQQSIFVRGGIKVRAKFVQRSIIGDATVSLTSEERGRLLALLTDIEARVAREMEGQSD
jgi:hypothetical protein